MIYFLDYVIQFIKNLHRGKFWHKPYVCVPILCQLKPSLAMYNHNDSNN